MRKRYIKYVPLYIPLSIDRPLTLKNIWYFCLSHGFLTVLAIIITNILFIPNLLYLFVLFTPLFRKPGTNFSWNPLVYIKFYCIDIHIILMFLVNLFMFLNVIPINIWIQVYTLVNIVAVTLRELLSPVIYHDKEGSYLRIRNRVRWVTYTFFSIFLVLLCFAIIYLYYGYHFCPHVTTSIDAIYLSLMTFTTLGYGDIKPLCSIGKQIVIYQLLLFVFIILGKLPVAISVIRVRVKK